MMQITTRPAALIPFRSIRLFAAGSALLLSACAGFTGIERTAQPRTPGAYATAATLPSQDGIWPDLSWPRTIGGAPLQALVCLLYTSPSPRDS